MQSTFGHVQVNVLADTIAFYRDLFTFLGWKAIYDDHGTFATISGEGPSLWFVGAANGAKNDYDGVGMNHMAIHVASQGDVDTAAAYLRDHDVAALFETPRHRPEFSGEGSTYYQVMFASPDNLLFEIVYIGPKAG